MNFAKPTGKHLFQNLSLIKMQVFNLQLYRKETPAQDYSCESCKDFKNLIIERLRTAVSVC